jgi:hypothetical protein
MKKCLVEGGNLKKNYNFWSIPTNFWPFLFYQGFNPKRPGLFGQLDTRGGGCGSPFWRTQSRASKFSFLSTNSISYKSWYLQLKFETLLRSLRSKLGPLEAAEVAKVQARKNVSHFLKSSIFELQKRNIPQKKAVNNRHLDLK